MTVPHSPLASPIKRPTAFPDFAQEELKKPLKEDVEAGITALKIVSPKTPGRIGLPGKLEKLPFVFSLLRLFQ